MAKPNTTPIILSLALSIIAISISIPNVHSQLSVSPILLTACPGLPVSSKITVYIQADRTGTDEDLYFVAQSSITPNSPSRFGIVSVNDDKLTAGPDYNSPEVGREQGTLASADLRVLSFAMNVNYHFTDGIYNGSSLSVLGRNPLFVQQSRELSVVGGTGIFRFARGYMIASTYADDSIALMDVFEHTFYVEYYSI